MVAFPGCKLNLGLHILAKRPDGYHAINTCFYPLPWTDVLEFLPAPSWAFNQSGLIIPGSSDDNLCVKAYGLLQRDFDISPVQGHLHKIVPMGAGLGGGSADAAHTLRMLNDLFALGLSTEQLGAYAKQVGSDCAFFLQDRVALGQGRGDELEPINLSLKGFYLMVITPGVHVSTAEAYAGVTPTVHAEDLRTVLARPVVMWREHLRNDFEPSVFHRYPELGKIKQQLYSLGASYASLSGSGSSLFGLFHKAISREDHFPGVHGWSGWL